MKHLAFGTDGIRGVFGQEPLTPQSLIKLGRALAQWALSQGKTHIALGHDTRLSSDLCKAAVKTGLLQFPVTLTDFSVIPTPVLFHRVQHENFDLGIMITASHNPAHHNGIKVLIKLDGKLNEHDEKEISSFFAADTGEFNCDLLGQETTAHNTQEWYINHLQTFFKHNFLHGLSVVLDCANGANSTLAPAVFKAFGATVTTLHALPNGRNINQACGAVHPESLQDAVKLYNVDFGCAFDGDGDRLTMVSKDGEVKNGDDLIAILSYHPAYVNQHSFVGTVMTNEGLVEHFTTHHKKFIRTPVGDKNITDALKKEHLLLGGEPSGHTILKDFSETSDGIFTALRCIETAQLTNNWNCKSFTKFPQVLINLPVSSKKDLNDPHLICLINEGQKSLIQGRLLVRYSGTEALLRIMVECNDEVLAHKVGAELSKQLALYLK